MNAFESALGAAARDLVRAGDRVLVAASGGADSTALAAGLALQARALSIEIVLGHVDHQLRPDSADDAAVVQSLASKLGVGILLRAVIVPAGRGGLEERARVVRHAALREMAREARCTRIATGHTQDDQAETVLLRLTRGAGLAGLSAMAAQTLDDIPVLRPLLGLSRKSARDYCADRALSFVDDSTNADRRFARNRIRADVMPSLAALNPRVAEALARTAMQAAADETCLAALAERALENARRNDGFDRVVLAALPRPLLVRALRALYVAAHGNARRLSSRHLAALEKAAQGAGPASVDLPDGLVARARYDRFQIAPLTVVTSVDIFDPIAVPGPGSYLFGAVTLEIEEGAHGEVIIDTARVPMPWTLRALSPGDRFHPLGALGRRKLKEFLIDAKIPREARATFPILVDGYGNVVWVVGLRVSQAAAPPWTRPVSLRCSYGTAISARS